MKSGLDMGEIKMEKLDTGGIELWNNTNIKALTVEEDYKYLEANNILYA